MCSLGACGHADVLSEGSAEGTAEGIYNVNSFCRVVVFHVLMGRMAQRPNPTETATAPSRLIRQPTVVQRVGLSPTTIWRERRAGRFPAPVRISPGAVAWLESDIDVWIAERAEAK